MAFSMEKENFVSAKYHLNFYLRPVLLQILKDEPPSRLQRWAWTMGAYPPDDSDPVAWWASRLG